MMTKMLTQRGITTWECIKNKSRVTNNSTFMNDPEVNNNEKMKRWPLPKYCSNSLYGADMLYTEDYEKLTSETEITELKLHLEYTHCFNIYGFKHFIYILKCYSFDSETRIRTEEWVNLMNAIHNFYGLSPSFKLRIIDEMNFYKITKTGELTHKGDSRNYQWFTRTNHNYQAHEIHDFMLKHFNLDIRYIWQSDLSSEFNFVDIDTERYLRKQYRALTLQSYNYLDETIKIYNTKHQSHEKSILEDTIINEIPKVYMHQSAFCLLLSSAIRIVKGEIMILKQDNRSTNIEFHPLSYLNKFNDIAIFTYRKIGKKWAKTEETNVKELIEYNWHEFETNKINF